MVWVTLFILKLSIIADLMLLKVMSQITLTTMLNFPSKTFLRIRLRGINGITLCLGLVSK